MALSATQYVRLGESALGLRRFRGAAAGTPQVLCIPYAGGQSLAFRPLADQLPADWGVWAIDPPGHGWCPGKVLDSVSSMVRQYLEHLPAELMQGPILLGHSLGGCVAFAMAQRMQATVSPPAAVILSGTRPPSRRQDYDSFLEMDDPTLLRTLIQIGGVPAEWAQEPELFDHFKGALRADFQAFESFEISGSLTGLPVLALGGMEDVVCRPEHVFEWSNYCPGCRIDFVSGGHMFLQSHPVPAAARITAFASDTARMANRS